MRSQSKLRSRPSRLNMPHQGYRVICGEQTARVIPDTKSTIWYKILYSGHLAMRIGHKNSEANIWRGDWPQNRRIGHKIGGPATKSTNRHKSRRKLATKSTIWPQLFLLCYDYDGARLVVVTALAQVLRRKEGNQCAPQAWTRPCIVFFLVVSTLVVHLYSSYICMYY
jgi:hypothetical protein